MATNAQDTFGEQSQSPTFNPGENQSSPQPTPLMGEAVAESPQGHQNDIDELVLPNSTRLRNTHYLDLSGWSQPRYRMSNDRRSIVMFRGNEENRLIRVDEIQHASSWIPSLKEWAIETQLIPHHNPTIVTVRNQIDEIRGKINRTVDSRIKHILPDLNQQFDAFYSLLMTESQDKFGHLIPILDELVVRVYDGREEFNDWSAATETDLAAAHKQVRNLNKDMAYMKTQVQETEDIILELRSLLTNHLRDEKSAMSSSLQSQAAQILRLEQRLERADLQQKLVTSRVDRLSRESNDREPPVRHQTRPKSPQMDISTNVPPSRHNESDLASLLEVQRNTDDRSTRRTSARDLLFQSMGLPDYGGGQQLPVHHHRTRNEQVTQPVITVSPEASQQRNRAPIRQMSGTNAREPQYRDGGTGASQPEPSRSNNESLTQVLNNLTSMLESSHISNRQPAIDRYRLNVTEYESGNFKNWLEYAKDKLLRDNIDESKWIHLITDLLKGEAFTKANMLIREKPNGVLISFQDFETRLLRLLHGYDNQQDAFMRMMKVKQYSTEKVADYLVRKNKALELIEENSESHVRYIIEGARPEIASGIVQKFGNQPVPYANIGYEMDRVERSLDDMAKFINRQQKAAQPVRQRQPTTRAAPRQSRTDNRSRSRSAESRSSSANSNRRDQPRIRFGRETSPKVPNIRKPSLKRASTDKITSDTDSTEKRICNICERVGHIARNCPRRSPSARQVRYTEQSDNEEHLSSDPEILSDEGNERD